MGISHDWRPLGHPLLWLAAAAAVLQGCGRAVVDDYGPGYSMDTRHVPDPVPRYESRSKYGNPDSYVVHGKRYHVMDRAEGFSERGIASWYGKKFHGRRTSSGETYDMYSMTAAHKTLPIPCYVRVTNLKNGRSTVVRVNDRGPFHDNRIIDLSYTAASKLGIVEMGTGLVEIHVLTPGKPDPGPVRVAQHNETRPITAAPAAIPVAAAAPSPRSSNQAGTGRIVDKGVSPSIHPASPATTAPQAPTPSPPAEAATVTGTQATPPATDAITTPVQMYLQLGAFISRNNAELLRSKLESGNIGKSFILEGTSKAAPIYRVRIGPLETVEEADGLATQISEMGIGNPSVVID